MVAMRGNRGPGCATCPPSQIDVVLYSGFHRVVYVCTVQELFSSRRVHIAPPPISLHCTCTILVKACGHSSPSPFPCTVPVLFPSRSAGITPPPPPIFCWGARLRLGLYTFSTRGRLSREIYHFSTFGGGGVF